MTGRSRRGLGILLLLAAGSAPGAAALRILHQPPRDVPRGAAVPIEVELSGVDRAAASVLLHYRAPGSSAFNGQVLRPHGGRSWRGEIPAAAAGGFEVSYYLEVGGAGAAVLLGSSEAPLTLRLTEPVPGARAGPAWPLAGGGAVLALCGLAARLCLRRRREALLARIYWARLLFPLLGLEPARLEEQLARLADTELEHPVDGRRRYALDELSRRLAEVRRLDVHELYRKAAASAVKDGAGLAEKVGG